jgi:hypothetical protein
MLLFFSEKKLPLSKNQSVLRIKVLLLLHVLAWLFPLGFPLLIAGALISRRTPPSTICFLGVSVPWAKLLARPLRSRICASASSRDMVGLRAGLEETAGRVV